MNVRFNDMQPANACAKTLFGVISAYGNHPSFSTSVTDVTVLSQDESGAEFPAGRKTETGKQAHAFDRCEVNGTVFGFERTYHGIDGSSTWIVCPAGQGRSALVLKRILYATDLGPFGGGRAARPGSRVSPFGVTSPGLPVAGSPAPAT
jgi:hypothetical protein